MPTKIKGLTGVDKVEAGAVITNPAFSGDATVSGSLTVGGVNVFSGPYRNLIINGDMRIAQRGTSVTGLSGSSTCQTVDRFALDLALSGTWTQTQDADVPVGQGFSSSLKMACTTSNGSLAANAYNIFHQRVESQFLQYLKYGTANAESVTLSFWVKSNKTGTYIAELYSYGNYQISQSYTINAANTWEKKTITYAGNTISSIPNNNSLGLYVNLFLAAGSDRSSGTLNTSWAAATAANRAVGQVNLADSTSNYINITGVQLEVGEGASDFEFLPYDVQLARCQRYYFASDTGEVRVRYKNAATVLTSYRAMPTPFPVTMRDAPTVTPNYTIGGGATSFSVFQSTTKSVTFGWAEASGGTTVTITADYVCSSEL